MQDVLSRIGRYDIKGRIGGGGMGTLYLARDTNPTTPRLVAVKLLRTNFDSEDLKKRFELEAQSLAQLSHQNIVVIHDSGEYRGSPYIVMEFVRGETFAELIRRKAPLSLGQKLRLLSELCTGLSHAHDAGIIHRDIKPANLMVDMKGPLKILDFGIARVDESRQSMAGGPLTQLNMRIGTPGYMSPEQIESGEIDTRSDLFAVGAVAYELIAYREAFPGATTRQVENKVLNDQPAPLEDAIADLDPEIGILVQSALEKDRTRRCQDAGTLARAFDRLRARIGDDGRSIRSTPTPKPSPEPRKRSTRNAEIAFERAVTARQDGADELARRSAMEALAESPEHSGAIDLLKDLGRFEDVRPWLPQESRPAGRPPAETELFGGDVRKPTEIYDKVPTPAPPPPPRSRRGLMATVAAVGAVVVIAIMAYALWPSPPATVKLTIDKPIGGTIRVGDFVCRPDSENCVVDLPVGQRVALEPAAGPGFEPTRFTGECGPRGEVVMAAPVTCGVTFGATGGESPLAKVYRLSVDKVQGGTVVGSGIECGRRAERCALEFKQPTEVPLSYRVDAGFRFDGWEGDCDGRGIVRVDGVVRCRPLFSQNTAIDSDNDGVLDSGDSCPGTPARVTVDGRGCPSQMPTPPPPPVLRDSDGDGVLNAGDRCDDTPRGQRVDSVGCPVIERPVPVPVPTNNAAPPPPTRRVPPGNPAPGTVWVGDDRQPMVWIPAGSVEGFWMDQYEVTNEAFARFVAENPRWAPGASNPDIGPRYLSHWINGAPTSGEARKPVNRVNLAAARAYAEWAGKRLPTDRQWVWAARAHQLTDFWWGAVPDPAKANLQTGVLQPVGSLDEPHPFKLYDILGNVMEWTVDETLRGGGFKSLPGYARLTSSAVYERNRMTFDEQYGFRCVLVR